MENIETIEGSKLVKDYTAEFAYYVSSDRALPSLVDGLKPVHRKAVQAAVDLGAHSNKPFIKTARLQGELMGSYHPHSAFMPTSLIQPFTIRYPIIEGSGSWGSRDDPSAVAAPRYTELRLSKFSEDFYLPSQDYAPKGKNYDGRLDEILQYNPPIPGCLLTNAMGIAVGLSTNVPTHEIGMICDSYVKYLTGKNFISGIYPDTCEPSITLTPLKEIKKMYETGSGAVEYKAISHRERAGKYHVLVVDSFPPAYDKKKLQKGKILQFVEEGRLSVSNESTTNIRYVFSSTEPEVLDEVETQLTSRVSYKFHIEHNHTVGLYSLKKIYERFTEERSNYLTRKYTDLREKAKTELRYNEQMLIFKRKNLVTKIYDKDEPEAIEFLSKYKIDEDIAKRILSTSIRSLTKENEQKFEEAIIDWKAKIDEYTSYLEDITAKIIADVKTLKKQYGGKPNTILLSSLGQSLENFRCYSVDENNNLLIENLNSDPKDHFHARVDSEYYVLYDDTGFVIVTGEHLKARIDNIPLRDMTGKLRIVAIDDVESHEAQFDSGKPMKFKTNFVKTRASKITKGNCKMITVQ